MPHRATQGSIRVRQEVEGMRGKGEQKPQLWFLQEKQDKVSRLRIG